MTTVELRARIDRSVEHVFAFLAGAVTARLARQELAADTLRLKQPLEQNRA